MRIIRVTLTLIVLAGVLAACGVRGRPEPPPGSPPPSKDEPFILDPLID